MKNICLLLAAQSFGAFPYRAIIVLIIVFLRLRLFPFGGASVDPCTVPFLLFTGAASFLLLAARSVVAALTVRALAGTLTSIFYPAYVHGLWGADGQLLVQEKQRSKL